MKTFILDENLPRKIKVTSNSTFKLVKVYLDRIEGVIALSKT